MILPRNTVLKSLYNATPLDDYNDFEDLSPVVSKNILSEKDLEDYIDGKINFEFLVDKDNKVALFQKTLLSKGSSSGFSQPKSSFNFKFHEASKPQAVSTCELDPSFTNLLKHYKEITATLAKFFNEKNDYQKKRLLSLFETLNKNTPGLLEKTSNVSDSSSLNYPKETLPKPQTFTIENIQDHLINFYQKLLSEEMSFWEQKIDSEINQAKFMRIKEYYDFLELYSKKNSDRLGLAGGNKPPSLFDSLSSFNFKKSDKNPESNLDFQAANNLASEFDKTQVELLLKEIEELHIAFKKDRKEALRTKAPAK